MGAHQIANNLVFEILKLLFETRLNTSVAGTKVRLGIAYKIKNFG